MSKPLLCTLLAFLCGITITSAQLVATQVHLINDVAPAKVRDFPLQGLGKAAACGTDTLYYNYYKTTAFNAVALNASTSGSAFAQWFPAPQVITVTGFDFYAFQSAGTSAVVTLTANIYLATSDSLPLGNPIRTVTVNVDSTFGNGQLSAMRKHVTFPTPATLSVPYLITLETSSSVNVSVICNSYGNADGKSEWLSDVKIAGNWLRSYAINVGGVAFNADFILKPTVDYSISADFDVVGCNEGNTAFTFTNKSSAVMQNKFYNRYAYYGIPQYGFVWEYGDSTFLQYAINGTHTYTKRLAYTVSLKDTMYGWTVGCADINSKVVPYRPLPPGLSQDGPVCSGDSVHLFADSLAGLQYHWTGPNGFSSTNQNLSFYQTDTSLNGPYSLQVQFMYCYSDDTAISLLIRQTPQKPIAVNDGPKCMGDSVRISASSPSPGITYYWQGPNSFNPVTNAFTLYNVDTAYAGTYSVYAADQFCTSDTDSTVLFIYPPPSPPLLSCPDDSLCQGDTLRLIGSSVTGASFEWIGPQGFTCANSDTLLVTDDPGQSGWYRSRVRIGSCSSGEDSIRVSVFATPSSSLISGMDTSTEGLTKTYSVTLQSGDFVSWSSTGGTILNPDSVSGQIEIQWGTPGTGHVFAFLYNVHGCRSAEESLEVDILQLPPPEDTTGDTTGDTTSIHHPQKSNWVVYPNPSSGKFLVESGQGAVPEAWFVYSMDGRLLMRGEELVNPEINCSDLSPGLYLLDLRSSGYRERHLIRIE